MANKSSASRLDHTRRLPETIAEVLKLKWEQFEKGVADLLKQRGYRSVQWVGGSGDLGVDITCQDKEGRSVAVQCKKYDPESRKISSPDIRNFFGGMRSVEYKADIGLFVTTSEFTGDARKFAKRNDITLIDGKKLLNLIRQAYRDQKDTPDAGEAATDTRRESGVIAGAPAPFMQHHIRGVVEYDGKEHYLVSKEIETRNDAALACASRRAAVCLQDSRNESQRPGALWKRKRADLIWSEYEKIRHLDPVRSSYLGAKRTRSWLENATAEGALRQVWGDENLKRWLTRQRILTRWSNLRSILTRVPSPQDSDGRAFGTQCGGQATTRASRTGGIREQFDGLIPDALMNYALRPHDPEKVKMSRIPDDLFTKRRSQVKGWLQDTLYKLHSAWHILLAVPVMNDAGEVVPEGVRDPESLRVRTEWTPSHEGVRSNTLLVWLEEAPSVEHNPQSGAISFDAL